MTGFVWTVTIMFLVVAACAASLIVGDETPKKRAGRLVAFVVHGGVALWGLVVLGVFS